MIAHKPFQKRLDRKRFRKKFDQKRCERRDKPAQRLQLTG
jgi:hypothetical protein